MAPTLTLYSGIGEIGGNKFLLEDGDFRVFLDFGRPAAPSDGTAPTLTASSSKTAPIAVSWTP